MMLQVIKKLSRVRHRAVNYTLVLKGSFWVLFLTLTACGSTTQVPVDQSLAGEKGFYQIKQMKRRLPNSEAILLGTVNDSRSKTRFAQLAMVVLNNQTVWADSTGHYKQEVKQGTYKIIGRNIFYNNVVVKHINIQKGDSLNIDFYLSSNPTVN